jgi:hypothetical protein
VRHSRACRGSGGEGQGDVWRRASRCPRKLPKLTVRRVRNAPPHPPGGAAG